MDKGYKYKKSKNNDEEVELLIQVESSKFLEVKEKIFNKLSKDVTLPGFRPGKAPKALIDASISNKVYDETLNTILPEVTASILEENKMTPLNQVKYDLVKFSDTEGIEFKATFVELPEIKLGDFSKIKVKKEEKVITDNDIALEITKIVQYYKNLANKDKDKKVEDIKEKDINDEMIKSLNLGFKTLKELQEQVKKELEYNSKKDMEVKYLDNIIKESVKISNIKAPKKIVKESVDIKEKEYLKKLEELNLKVDDFLKVQNTTIEKLKEDWKKDAEYRFSEELLLLKIIQEQNIKISDEEFNAEIAKITDAKSKEQLNTIEGKRYLITVLLQQKAINWIKNQVSK